MKLPNHWHKLAELFLEKKLTMPEIGKLMIINEAIGLIEGNEEAERIGINVIDHSNLHDSLVFGILMRQPTDTPISYIELAELLDISVRRVGSSVDRLTKRGVITKDDRGRLGSLYAVYPDRFRQTPKWIIEFAGALIELHNNAELKSSTAKAVSDTQFYRGFQVLQKELRDKFYRPRKEPQS